MGFWVFMLIMVLLIPIIMITFGKLFSKKAPKDINYTFGYRTKRSMMNMETWMFAHAYIGKLWSICGLLLFPLSAVVMTFVFGKGPDTVGIAGGILTIRKALRNQKRAVMTQLLRLVTVLNNS